MLREILLRPWVLDGCAGFGYTRVDFQAPAVEELDEAYVPAESSQEGKNARLSQAHAHGRWAKDHRRPAPARAEAAGRLIVAEEQTHTADRLSGVRKGLPAGRGVQGQSVLRSCFPQRARYSPLGPLCLPESRRRGDAQRGSTQAQRGLLFDA